jgi:hypothetical protein
MMLRVHWNPARSFANPGSTLGLSCIVSGIFARPERKSPP